MEPELRLFFSRIIRSISMSVLWMLINMTLGVFFDFAFIHNSVSLANILFYIFFACSLAGLTWYLLKVWKQPVQA